MDVPMEKREKEKIEEAHEQDEIERLVGDFVASQTGSSERLGDIVFQDLSVIGAGVGVRLFHH